MPQWLINDPDISSETIRVYAFLAIYEPGWCRKGILQIAAELRMSPYTVKQCLKTLREFKLIANGKPRPFHPTARRTTPYGQERFYPVPVDAVTSLSPRSLRVLAMVDQARRRRVPDPTVEELVRVCGFWNGKPVRPSTIKTALRELRKGGWLEHMKPPVPRPAIMDEPVVEQEEGAVFEQPELIPVDVIRDIVQGPLTPQNDPDRFEEFWRAYPRKVGKGAARKAWVKALDKTTAQVMIDAAKQFRLWMAHTEPRWVPHASTWLNGERWDDEPDEAPAPRSTADERVDMAAEAGRRFIERYGNVDFTELDRRRRRGEIEGF